MNSQFANPIMGNVPTGSAQDPTKYASIAPAHKQGQTNDLKPVTQSMANKPMGSLGLIGNGQQK